MKKAITISIFLMAAAIVNAATETVDGITWTYTVTEDAASIGGGSSSITAVPTSTSGAITIPSTLGGKPVNRIWDYAFYNCTRLTSVTIPDGVTSIGERAVCGCSSLMSVTIPDSVIYFGPDCFEGCPAYMHYLRKLYKAVLGGNLEPASTTIVEQVEAAYSLTNAATDRSIASVTVDGDCAIDEFVLTDGKVYDSVLYVNNTADRAVTLSLPTGYEYMVFKDAKPLLIPANSRHIITITRVADRTFLVSREELEALK